MESLANYLNCFIMFIIRLNKIEKNTKVQNIKKYKNKISKLFTKYIIRDDFSRK